MKKGFALIYTLLFIVLLLIAVSATWFTGMADLRLAQRSSYSIDAMQLAKSGIDDGFTQYMTTIGSSANKLQKYPNAGVLTCAGSGLSPVTDPKVKRTVINTTDQVTVLPSDPNLTATIDYFTNPSAYDYYICGESIYAVGYYKGSKISLKAVVTHVETGPMNGTEGTTCDSTGFPTCLWDHSEDYITTYQVGPS